MTDIVSNAFLFMLVMIQNVNSEIKTTTKKLKLGQHTAPLGPIQILDFEPTPEDFYHDYIRKSVPVLIRTKNPSWHGYLSAWKKAHFLRQHHGKTYGRAYKRPVWTQGWPVEVRVTFDEFLDGSKDLYWDSEFPMNSDLLKHIPLPLSMHCHIFKDWIADNTLLYTNQNASSVFHQDGSENIFFQISGRKTWLLANHSYSERAYANSYNTQPGLSPINPEEVDLNKFPLAAEIEFYEVVTEPGDMLYVPQYWWHQVRSFDPPIIALNLWLDIFNYPDLENVEDVVESTKKFAYLRELEPSTISCKWQSTSLYDVEHQGYDKIFGFKESDANFPLYFGSDEGAFYAINSADSDLIWKHSIKGDAGSTPVLSVDGQKVYFADESSSVYQLAAGNGTVLWKTHLKDGVAAALRLSDDNTLLFVASLDGHIYAISTTDGSIFWKVGPLGGEIWSSPYLHHAGIIVCVWTVAVNQPNVFFINSLDGNVVWKFVADNSVFSSPAVDTLNDVAYIVDITGHIHGIDIDSGAQVWNYDVKESCEASPVLDPEQNRLYFVTSSSGLLECIDISDSSLVWKLEFNISAEDEPALSSPLFLPASNTIYAAVGNALYAVNADTGSVIWQFSTDDSFISSPRIDINGVIYIGCNDNSVYAIDSEDGSLVWSLLTAGPVVSSIAIPREFASNDALGSLM